VLIRRTLIFLSLVFIGAALNNCGTKDELTKKEEPTSNEVDMPTFTALDTGATYELPIAATLYPDHGMDTASADSLDNLMVLPKGSGIRVFSVFMEGNTPWYAVRVVGGPTSGWKNVGGRRLDSLTILGWISESGGIPGWINHKDIEGLPLRYAPAADKDTANSK